MEPKSIIVFKQPVYIDAKNQAHYVSVTAFHGDLIKLINRGIAILPLSIRGTLQGVSVDNILSIHEGEELNHFFDTIPEVPAEWDLESKAAALAATMAPAKAATMAPAKPPAKAATIAPAKPPAKA
jgi:hypothetical protein